MRSYKLEQLGDGKFFCWKTQEVCTAANLPRGLSGSGHWALGTQLLKQLDDRAKGGPDSPNVITYNTAPGQELGLGLLWGFGASANANH